MEHLVHFSFYKYGRLKIGDAYHTLFTKMSIVPSVGDIVCVAESEHIVRERYFDLTEDIDDKWVVTEKPFIFIYAERVDDIYTDINMDIAL